MDRPVPGILGYASRTEIELYGKLFAMLQTTPIPEKELLANLGLFLTRPTLSRILCLARMYERQLTVPGVVLEFGCRWGHNLALMATLRNIMEPHNYWRKIVGFDTFAGFPSISGEHDQSRFATIGNFTVSEGYESVLSDIMSCHEELAPRPHLRRFELVKGDVSTTVPDYFAKHPETIVSLAYFDLDLYEPTKAALKATLPHLVKGSVLVFDELCLADFPGETVAVAEAIGLDRLKLVRDPASVAVSYAVFGE
jgi:Macrocin-O-methyltransferase (TylF)